MSAAKSRASGLSVGKNSTMQSQSFSSCQYGSKSSFCFVPKNGRTLSPLFGTKLAIHRRYTERRFFCIPYCHLQGTTMRPVPCNYNVFQCVSALSRRRRGFKSRRGRQYNNLREKCLLPAVLHTAAIKRQRPIAHEPSTRPTIPAPISEGSIHEPPLAKKSPGVANARPIQQSVTMQNAEAIARQDTECNFT